MTLGTNQKLQSLDTQLQGALKPGSVEALLPGNLLSHSSVDVQLGNNARSFLKINLM